jgi:hypothetical protein
MGTITTTKDPNIDLVIVRADGTILAGDLGRWITGFYRLDKLKTESKPTHIAELILFDLSGADLEGITAGDIRQFAQKIGQIRKLINRRTGKTAFVTGEELTYDLGKMFEAFLHSVDDSLEVRIFRTLVEAKVWLGAM